MTHRRPRVACVADIVIGRGAGKIINIASVQRALVADADFSDWLKKRTPAGRWGKVEELVGAAVFLSSAAPGFVQGHTLYVTVDSPPLCGLKF
jgi:NAD(P)-dependent dehydrogenase (short-subunit alcohol dehydrogenase family)